MRAPFPRRGVRGVVGATHEEGGWGGERGGTSREGERGLTGQVDLHDVVQPVCERELLALKGRDAPSLRERDERAVEPEGRVGRGARAEGGEEEERCEEGGQEVREIKSGGVCSESKERENHRGKGPTRMPSIPRGLGEGESEREWG